MNITPDWTKLCECGTGISRYRGETLVICPTCAATYNAAGQRYRNDWHRNPSNYDAEISDLDGYAVYAD